MTGKKNVFLELPTQSLKHLGYERKIFSLPHQYLKKSFQLQECFMNFTCLYHTYCLFLIDSTNRKPKKCYKNKFLNNCTDFFSQKHIPKMALKTALYKFGSYTFKNCICLQNTNYTSFEIITEKNRRFYNKLFSISTQNILDPSITTL